MENISFEGIITKSTGGLYTVEKKDGTSVKVGCRAFSGACLRNRDETILHLFAAGEEQDIDVEDLRQIFKDNSVIKARSLFEKGIFYFVDNKQI